MPKVTIKIPWRYRIILFVVILTSWITGISIQIFQQWIRVQGDFGLEFHPLQADIRKVHGASAFAMMIIYGFLLGTHIPTALKQKRQYYVGLSLLAFNFILIITGYCIYYASNKSFLEVIKITHLIVGITFPLLLIIHIVGGIIGRRKKQLAI